MNDDRTMNDARLVEFDKTEWRDVARLLKPEISDEAFEEMWEEFCTLKYFKGFQ